jgi:DNA polymerase III delta prime subunit
MSVGQHAIRFKGTDSTLDLDVTYIVDVQDYSNLDEVITIALEEMKKYLPEVIRNVNVTIDERSIENIEEVLRAAIPTLGMDKILQHDKVDLELLKTNIRNILFLAAGRARSNKRKEMMSRDLTNTILEANVSRVNGWPFRSC